jgi:hypothetical protein
MFLGMFPAATKTGGALLHRPSFMPFENGPYW